MGAHSLSAHQLPAQGAIPQIDPQTGRKAYSNPFQGAVQTIIKDIVKKLSKTIKIGLDARDLSITTFAGSLEMILRCDLLTVRGTILAELWRQSSP